MLSDNDIKVIDNMVDAAVDGKLNGINDDYTVTRMQFKSLEHHLIGLERRTKTLESLTFWVSLKHLISSLMVKKIA